MNKLEQFIENSIPTFQEPLWLFPIKLAWFALLVFSVMYIAMYGLIAYFDYVALNFFMLVHTMHP